MLKQTSSLLAIVLGFLGTVLCAAGIGGAWSIGSRLREANENVFEVVDTSLATVRDGVLTAQKSVQESMPDSASMRQSLESWTRREATERLTTRLEVEQKAERLGLMLQQTDQWLEMSSGSIQSIKLALELGGSLGAPVDASNVDPLLEKLGSLRIQLKQATEAVEGIRERTVEITDGGAQENRIDQVLKLAIRVAAMVLEIDTRLGEYADRLSQLRRETQRLKSKTNRWILIGAIGFTLLFGWMGIGQVSLCRSGWKGFQQARAVN